MFPFSNASALEQAPQSLQSRRPREVSAPWVPLRMFSLAESATPVFTVRSFHPVTAPYQKEPRSTPQPSSHRPRQRLADDRLRFLLDVPQVVASNKALRVELVDVFRAGRTRRKPPVRGDDL